MTDRQLSIEEPTVVPQLLKESGVSKKKQRKRTVSYLSDITKQVEKNGNQINKIVIMIQSLQKEKQKQSKLTAGPVGQKQFQYLKQIESQISQLRKHVTQIQNDIRRIRTASAAKTKTKTIVKSRKQVKARSKKSKSKIKRKK